jgi:hypothetical protein
MAPGMRRLAGIAVLVIALSASTPAAVAATSIQHSGDVTGDLKPGKVVTAHIAITHPKGWHSVQNVVIALRLRGRILDEILFTSSELSLSIEGDGGPMLLGQEGLLRGPYFQVDNSRWALQASGRRLGLSVPIKVTAAPPPGGGLFYSYSALGAPASGFLALTPPVKATGGFSWGTLGLAVAVALFAGGFVGNLVASSRRRQQRPSIYAAVERRLGEDRASR